MEVHIGKYHTDVFECGICDYIADTEENLDIHLFTCEIYECTGSYGSFPKRPDCNLSGKDLSEMKRHIVENHSTSVGLNHFKMDRNKEWDVTLKSYSYSDV